MQSSQSYSSLNPQALAARKSTENVRRPVSARQSLPLPGGQTRSSNFDNSPQGQAEGQPGRWDAYANIFGGPGQTQGQGQQRPQQTQTPRIMLQSEQEYSHAFGKNEPQVQEAEYYEAGERQQEQFRPDQMRRESTSEMLSLGRYDGFVPRVTAQG